ncbi:MAG: DNA damage-inducible protein D [Clostridia bacterium]|nr:DNA damage-inducible protein D [Clostridia bacterium]
MLHIIKQEINMSKKLLSKIEWTCKMKKVKLEIINGCLRIVEHTNLAYVEPHQVIIKGKLYLFFNEIALAQTYFAIQTRKQEISEKEYSSLTEDEKRFYQKNLTKKGNYSLNQTAKNAGVKNFDKFHNFGYKGLYNGETADDIAKRKGVRYREDILDNMGSDELIANLFRISQTEQKLKRDDIQSEKEANIAHYEVGSKIRKTIKELGGTMPEDLPTPKKSLKQLEKENKKSLKKK